MIAVIAPNAENLHLEIFEMFEMKVIYEKKKVPETPGKANYFKMV